MSMSCRNGWVGLMATIMLPTAASADPAADVAARIARLNETDRPGLIDYGYGIGRKTSALSLSRALTAMASSSSAAVPAAVPAGSAAAATGGVFGPVVPWPIIPLHVILLPDGRVMNYGTGTDGTQTGQFIYDVWDPTQGTGANAHLTLPNTTATDIFCSAQSLLVWSGKVLLTGGDLTINGTRNYANNKVEVFDPGTNTIAPATSMAYQRWYPSITPLPNGGKLIMGGIGQTIAANGAITKVPTTIPEYYDPRAGWRTLPNQTTTMDWYYPHSFAVAGGWVLDVDGYSGHLFRIDPTGSVPAQQLPATLSQGSYTLPTIMYAPGKLLTFRTMAQVATIDVTGPSPVINAAAPIAQESFWANATLLADGTVFVNGGSAVDNQLLGVVYQSELWNPTTGVWTRGASATRPRLYHSVALLLPDATVLTGAGGAPGPVANLNAEIYYPPYLYRADGSGNPAPRPTLSSATSFAQYGKQITAIVGVGDNISRLTMVRAGSVTHSNNIEQRVVNMAFTQTGRQLVATVANDPLTLLPGYYMLFAFNAAGTPSVARMVRISS